MNKTHRVSAIQRLFAPVLWILAAVLVMAGCVNQYRSREGVPLAPPAVEIRHEGPSRIDAEADTHAGREADSPDGIMHERYLKRLSDDGRIPPNALMRARRQAGLVPQLANPELMPRDAGLWNWEWLGPGNIGGRIRAVAVNPNDATNWFIGGVAGGIWRTNNSGTTWTALNDFLPSLAVSCLAIDPTNTSILYGGTGEGFCNLDALPGAGVFKSTNGGSTWTQLTETIPTNPVPTADNWGYVNRLAIKPTDGQTILAATNRGIWRSTNGGTSWSQRNFVRTLDARFSPANPSNAVAGSTGGTVRFSTDSGLTWVVATMPANLFSTTVSVNFVADPDNLPDLLQVASSAGFAAGDTITVGPEFAGVVQVVNANTLLMQDLLFNHAAGQAVNLAPQGRVELAWGPGCTVYASMDAGGGTILRSNDCGQNFAMVTGPNNTPDYLGTQGCYGNSIWVATDNANTVVVGGINVWRSTTGGPNLMQITARTRYHNPGDSAHADQHGIFNLPGFSSGNSATRAILACNDGGIQRNADVLNATTTNWTNVGRGLGITQFYGGSAARDGSVIMGGAQDNDTVRFRPGSGANAWYQAETGDGGFVAVDYDNTSNIYAEYINLLIKKSEDGGDSYSYHTNGLADAGGNALFIAPFVIDPNQSNVLVAGGQSIWRTTNNADDWVSIRAPIQVPNPNAPPPTIACATCLCSAICVSLANSNIIYVGYNVGQIWRSRVPNSSNWDRIDRFPLPAGRFITDIQSLPGNVNVIFVTTGGYNASAGDPDVGDNVWRGDVSYNAATNTFVADWTPVNGTLPTALPVVPVHTVAVHPTNPNWIYVGTDVGVFASENGGATWNRTPQFSLDDGPVYTEVTDLFWQGTQYLIATTYGRGMFRVRPLVTVYVDRANTSGVEDGSPAHPYNTATEGEGAAGNGTDIVIRNGDYPEGHLRLFKRGYVWAENGAVRIH